MEKAIPVEGIDNAWRSRESGAIVFAPSITQLEERRAQKQAKLKEKEKRQEIDILKDRIKTLENQMKELLEKVNAITITSD